MSVCSVLYNVERAFCVGANCGRAPDTRTVMKDTELSAPRDLAISQRGSPPTSHVPPWKFWRRLSSRRAERKPDKADSKLDSRSVKEHVRLTNGGSSSAREDDHLDDLPDVLDKTALRRSQSLKPPPKPPRLFLMRSSSINTHRNSYGLSSARNSFIMTSNRDSKDEEFIKIPINIDSGRFHATSSVGGGRQQQQQESRRGDVMRDGIDVEEASRCGHNGTTPMRIKMDLNTKNHLGARSRKRSGDKLTRHRIILHVLSELLCQKLEPSGLIDQLFAVNVITSGDLQAFRGHPDRRLVCESLISSIARGHERQFSAFCEVLRNSGKNVDISDLLDAMTGICTMISDVRNSYDEDNPVLAEEKTMSFDVGLYDMSVGLLKPVVELDRVSSTGGGRRRNRGPTKPRSSQISNASSGSSGVFSESEKLVPMMTVCISGHNLQGDRTKALADIMHKYNCILELRLGKTQLTGSDMGLLSIPLQKSPSVAVLDVRLNNFGNEGASMLGNALEQNTTLRQLNLSSTGMDGSGCKRICNALKRNSVLVDLDMSFVETGDEGCVHIADMLRHNCTLKRLRLRSNNITWNGCAFVFEALHSNRSLTELDLSRNYIGDEGVEIVSEHLARNPSLKELSLENCGLSTSGCAKLSNALSLNTSLFSLDLSVNFIGDTGVCRLCEALDVNCNLKTLGLNMCGVTNDGFSRLLDALESNKCLTMLKLCYNRLGRDSVSSCTSSEDLRYRVRIVTSSRPKLKLLLWGNTFEES